MKKFEFKLEKLLSYKTQMTDSELLKLAELRKQQEIREEELKDILRKRGILDRIQSRDVLEVIDSLSDEDTELLLDRGTWSALSGLLEGIDGV